MLNSSTGGKSMGSGWKGRAWRAVMRVASRVGGSGDSGGCQKGWVKREGEMYCPSPLRRRLWCVLHLRLLCLLLTSWELVWNDD